ncbi:MAG: hypothetical protein GEU68_12875 [Actinobacteria bacterium]|nr:hypothetical protein [Actinomycetota bacterium]
MDRQGQAPRKGPSRRLLALLVWPVAIAWSVYLVMADVNSDGGMFAVIVQAMGSIGILYALFLVTRPQKRGVLGPLGVFREDIVPEGDDEKREPSSTAARWAIITITLALAIGGLIYRLTQDNYLHQSAAFFIGVPAVLAITLALTPKAKSATGMIVKGLTLALLLSGVVFFEGFICILMAAPLFYLVGIVIGIPIDRARRKRQSEGRVYSIVGIGLLLLSIEGVTPATSFSHHEVVSVTQTVDASATDVRAALATTPTFDASLPFYLKLGFPRPVAAYGSGLDVGDRRTIVFGKESPMEPMGESHKHHHNVPAEGSGVLELEVVRSTDGLVVFKPVDDKTAFTHWISWGRSVIRWRAVDAHSTEVTWTLHFKRRLSPSWYFGPWQRYAAEKATGYLIRTVATP